jgi:hypothetical protein
VDVNLALQLAESPELEENDELRKKLWLLIAKHVLEKDRDIMR